MEMLMSFEAKAAAKKGRQAAFDGKQEGRLRHAGRAEMISSEPIAWNGLVEDQCEERQQQAKTAEQRDRDKRINVARGREETSEFCFCRIGPPLLLQRVRSWPCRSAP